MLPAANASSFRQAHLIDLGAARVCCRRVGTGPALVLLHGFPLSGLTWRKVVPELAQRFTCYTLDLVGLGESRSGAAVDYSSPGQAVVLRQALRAQGVTSYALMGNDTG